MRRVAIALFLATIASLAASANAAMHTIENQTLSVAYDDAAKTFSATEKATGKVFLKDGRLDGVGGEVQTVAGAIEPFGHGRSIVVSRTDGGRMVLTLCDALPFLLIQGRLHNSDAEQRDVRTLVPAAFALDLGKPVGELRTLGTAGLTAPDKNPGSYLFLTLAEPATRRGVVAGWLTNDRAAGVLFSNAKDGQVEFRPQLEYGHLRIPAKTSADLETLAIGCFDDARLGLEQFADAVAKQYKIKLRPQIGGYCTWYSDQHGGAGDEKSVVELAQFVAKQLKPFGFSFMQIDDQWQDGKEYNGPCRGFDRVKPSGPYPHGMKPVADRFKELGLTAGIWFMPFARNHQAPEYKDRQHWFVKREDGKPFETPWRARRPRTRRTAPRR